MTETAQPKKTAEDAAVESELSETPSNAADAASKEKTADTSAASCADKAAASEAAASKEASRSDEQKALDSLSPHAANADSDKAAEERDARAALDSLGDPAEVPEHDDSPGERASGGFPKRTIAIVLAVLAALGLIAWSLVSFQAARPQNDSPDALEQRELADAQRSSDGMAVESIAIELLDQMKSQDSAFVASLATHVDEGFYTLTGYHHADLGVDPTMLAIWMLTDFDYDLDGVYAEGDTATVYATVTVRDALTMANSFYNKAYDYFNSPAALGLDEEAAKTRMGELYQEALAEPAQIRNFNATFEFEKRDGDWAIRQDSFNTELSLMFGVYDQGVGEGAV